MILVYWRFDLNHLKIVFSLWIWIPVWIPKKFLFDLDTGLDTKKNFIGSGYRFGYQKNFFWIWIPVWIPKTFFWIWIPVWIPKKIFLDLDTGLDTKNIFLDLDTGLDT